MGVGVGGGTVGAAGEAVIVVAVGGVDVNGSPQESAREAIRARASAAMGVLVAIDIAHIMARIFSDFNPNIQPHVTLRSLIISSSDGGHAE